MSLLLYINAAAQVKTAILGSISNGQPVMTDISRAKEVLMGSLPSTAIASDIRIFYVESERAYYLSAKVANDPILFIAIEMTIENSLLCVKSGPGYEITCVGDKCNDCVSKTPKGKNTCYCASPTGQVCSSVVSTIINF